MLDAERGAEDGTYRRVQLFTPPSPQLHISIDHPTPNEAGPNRDYRVGAVGTDQSITFTLQPHQKVFAMVAQGDGFGIASIIVEYLEAG